MTIESLEIFSKRFWSKVSIRSINECWEWQGAVFVTGGYGQIGWNYKTLRAHRVAWILKRGKISDKILVLHKCDNPKCVNPNHLFLGTYLDNNLDKIQKGRTNRRERTSEMKYKTKLTENDIKEIRNLIEQGISHRKIGGVFNVSHTTIGYIRRGERWKHVK